MSSPTAPSRRAPSGRASALPPDERRSEIVEATVPLLAEYGERVTIRQIARAAGIAEGTIFGVFSDKAEVLSAALEAALDTEPLEQQLTGIDPTLPLEAQLIEAVTAIQSRLADMWQLVSSLGPRLQHQARRPFRDSPAIAALFEPHADQLRVEPSEAARLLRALIISLNHPMVGGTPTSAATVVDLFLHGVEDCERNPQTGRSVE